MTEAKNAPVQVFRSGLVAVVGRPNVGKSTLTNALVGSRVSIVSPKPQTTRHRILGVVTSANAQVLLVDTPGLHVGGGRAMNRYLNRVAVAAFAEVHAVALIVAAGRWTDADQRVFELASASPLPRVLVVNKIDRIKDKRQLLPYVARVEERRGFAAVYAVSALRRDGLDGLLTGLASLLPVAAPAFGADAVTDRSARFLVGELIREQLTRQLGDELPYSCSVEIERFEDETTITRIAAVIWVERDSQKGIVIGAAGQQARAIGKASRVAIERLLGRRVFLQIWCKVRENWSDDDAALQRLGYRDA